MMYSERSYQRSRQPLAWPYTSHGLGAINFYTPTTEEQYRLDNLRLTNVWNQALQYITDVKEGRISPNTGIKKILMGDFDLNDESGYDTGTQKNTYLVLNPGNTRIGSVTYPPFFTINYSTTLITQKYPQPRAFNGAFSPEVAERSEYNKDTSGFQIDYPAIDMVTLSQNLLLALLEFKRPFEDYNQIAFNNTGGTTQQLIDQGLAAQKLRDQQAAADNLALQQRAQQTLEFQQQYQAQQAQIAALNEQIENQRRLQAAADVAAQEASAARQAQEEQLRQQNESAAAQAQQQQALILAQQQAAQEQAQRAQITQQAEQKAKADLAASQAAAAKTLAQIQAQAAQKYQNTVAKPLPVTSTSPKPVSSTSVSAASKPVSKPTLTPDGFTDQGVASDFTDNSSDPALMVAPKKDNTAMIVGLSVAGLAAVGGGYYWWKTAQKGKKILKRRR